MGAEVSMKKDLFSLITFYPVQCCKIIPYIIESNEDVNPDQNILNKYRKIETESGDAEFKSNIIQNEYFDNFNNNILNQEKNNSNFEETKEEKTLLDLVKLKEIFRKSKILNLEIASFNSNIVSSNNIITTTNEEQDNTTNYKEKKKISIQINPLGYSKSKRKKDGITYFGYKKEDDISEENEIDIKINPIDNEVIDEKYYGKHFQIRYNMDDLQYYLKDLGHGFGTFIKIIDWIEIKNNFLLNVGDNYLVFSIGLENESDINENYILKNRNQGGNSLNVKIFSGNSKQNNLIFTSSDSPFTIGRKSDNAINIDDNMLSRIHCTIKYKDKKWFLIDGSINEQNGKVENKKSTNGSWIYAYEDCLIKDKMIFKAAHYLFECKLVDISNNDLDLKKE